MSRGGPFGGRAVITGAGKSQVGRRLGRTGLELTVEACLRAIEDAGLTVDDIDGVASYPGGGVPQPGFSGASTHELQNALGIAAKWYMSGAETAGQIGPVIEACMAVSLGLANHVVVFRSVWESTADMESSRIRIRGSRSMARAMAMRWRCPPDRPTPRSPMWLL